MAIDRYARSLLLCLVLTLAPPAGAATLGISADGRFFTIDSVPVFLNGISYYGAESITTGSLRTQDLDDMVADGFNWMRVWGYWKCPGSDEDVSVLTHDGYVRSTYMDRLKTLIVECNARGIIVDVSLNRDAAGTWVGARNQTEHLNAVRTLASELKTYRNVYIDISNERDVGDGRYVSLSECGQLIDAIKAIDPARLCTASSTPTSKSDCSEYRNVAHMDFITPHLCRDAGCPAQTLGTVQQFIGWMSEFGWRIPVHLQEPFRRGYSTTYNPVAEDFLRDCSGGKIADAAGWCLHNGSNFGGRPYRSFNMADTEGRLYAQLDSNELQVTNQISDHIDGAEVFARRYQVEYDEQLARQIGRRDGEGRSANVAQDAAGYLSYGPYTTSYPAGTYEASWRMLVDNNSADNEAVVRIDVYDPDGSGGGQVLAEQTIQRQEFTAANTYQTFTLTFVHGAPSHRLEFRTYWHDRTYLKLDYVQVHQKLEPAAPIICEVNPDPDTVMVGNEYIRQLALCGGYPAPTWSVESGPSGLQVDSNGRVCGWTPTSSDGGQTVTVTIRATNTQGYDDETWQVNVQTAVVPVFEDQLQDSSQISGQYGGGSFTSSGYTLNNRTDFVYYNFSGVGSDGTGSMECDVRGLYPNAGATKNHIITACDRAGCCDAGVNPCDPITNGWAIYGSNYWCYIRKVFYNDPTYDNKMKMVGSSMCAAQETFTAATYSWDGLTTYRFRITWTGNHMRYYRGLPGQALELTKEYYLASDWLPAQLHVQLGGTSIAQIAGEIGGAPGTCYSLFRVYEDDLGGAATSGGGGPYPPDIAEASPDPDAAFVGTEYVKQLALTQGTPPITWTVLQPLAGVQVDNTGRVSGWIPSAAEAGNSVTFEIQAANEYGSDTESWQVQVFAVPEDAVAEFPFNSGVEGWTLETWKAGQYQLGSISWDSSGGNPGGNMRSTGSGETNTNDSCTREGSRMTRLVSTSGYSGIQVRYDAVASLNAPPTSDCTANCQGELLGGSCEDKLVVSYSTAGTSGPWTIVHTLIEGVSLPTTWSTKVFDLSSLAEAGNNPDFALRFEWQFNTAADSGRIDNIRVLGTMPTWARADVDDDDDVDQEDFGHFQQCLSGNASAYGPDCEDMDFDGDGDVDKEDFGVFLPCLGGAEQPPGCE